MTTTIAKGTNRPAAKARTAKAAQRTPLPPKAPRKLGTLAEEASKAPDTGAVKADAFVAFVAQCGWTCKTTKDGLTTKVVAKRGREVMTVVWSSGCYDYPASGYKYGSYSRKLLNVSAARQLAALVVTE
jgi:hypothetical protein